MKEETPKRQLEHAHGNMTKTEDGEGSAGTLVPSYLACLPVMQCAMDTMWVW